VVDPDDAHLYKSLGCAAENLVEAAVAQGLATDARFDNERNAVLRTAFINQPIEVQSLRGRFETVLGLDGEQALLAVRFGHGVLAPFSLRRPIDDVIVS
jgi:hypothetical protein